MIKIYECIKKKGGYIINASKKITIYLKVDVYAFDVNSILTKLKNDFEKRKDVELNIYYEMLSNNKFKTVKGKIKTENIDSLIFCDLTINKKSISKLRNLKRLCDKHNVALIIITKDEYYDYIEG